MTKSLSKVELMIVAIYVVVAINLFVSSFTASNLSEIRSAITFEANAWARLRADLERETDARSQLDTRISQMQSAGTIHAVADDKELESKIRESINVKGNHASVIIERFQVATSNKNSIIEAVTVTIHASGDGEAIERFIDLLEQLPSPAKIVDADVENSSRSNSASDKKFLLRATASIPIWRRRVQ